MHGRSGAPDTGRTRTPGAGGSTVGALAGLVAVVALTAGCSGGDGDDVRLFGTASDAPERITLAAAADGATRATLSWTDGGGRYAYLVERNGKAVGDTDDRGFTDTGLAAGERHCWRVLARNGFGWQARSNEACVGTVPTDTAWRVQTLATGRWPALAIDANGDLHACFVGLQGVGVSYLRVAPERAAEPVDVDGQGQCSLRVGPDNIVHVAYLSRFGLRHATRATNGVWSASTVDAQARAGNQRFDGPALALGADRLPRVAYRRLGTGGLAPISVAVRSATGWTFDLTAIDGLVGPRSLAIDPVGTLRLATTDELGQSIRAWRREPGGWVRTFSDSLAPNAGDGPPIAIDVADAARVAWWSREAPTTANAVTLRWFEESASGVRAETIDELPALGTRVAIGTAGTTSRVAAVDAAGQVRVYTRAATGWTRETLTGQAGAAASVDVAIGSDGQLRVLFDRVGEGQIAIASRAP